MVVRHALLVSGGYNVEPRNHLDTIPGGLT
jgi:hypothetical protein